MSRIRRNRLSKDQVAELVGSLEMSMRVKLTLAQTVGMVEVVGRFVADAYRSGEQAAHMAAKRRLKSER